MSKHIFRNEELNQDYPSFLDRLKTSHEVQDELPANQYTKSQIDQRFQEAFQSGLEAGQDSGFQKGREEGYQEGLASGQQKAAEEFEAAHAAKLTEFGQSLEQLRQKTEAEMEQWYVEAERRLAGLAVEIARRAIGTELSLQEEAVVEIARQVLAETTEGTHFRIFVNVAEAPVLESRRQQLVESIAHVRDIEIVSDPSIQAGCVVESGASTIDARVETYLRRLAETIQEEAA